nr:mediator of RNA polymerase II transcription subunit 15 [Drosophila bipectinata]
MDAKRGNAPGARQGTGYQASKTSMASRQQGGGAAAVGRKPASEISLTPSQARNPDNPRKSPLDALSRSGIVRSQDPFQRRSGLQDVDDAFLASNAFARPPRVRHSGLERDAMPQAAAGGGAAASQQQQQQGSAAAVAPIRMSAGQDAGQQQMDQQQVPPPQQVPPASPAPSQQQQQYAQQPAAGQPTRLEPPPSGRAHPQHQHQAGYEQQQQQQQDSQAQNKYQQQSHHHQQQQQQPTQQQQQTPQQGYVNISRFVRELLNITYPRHTLSHRQEELRQLGHRQLTD